MVDDLTYAINVEGRRFSMDLNEASTAERSQSAVSQCGSAGEEKKLSPRCR